MCSPNFDRRPEGTVVELVVVHGISLPPGRFGGQAIEQLFTNRLDTAAHPFYRQLEGVRVSSHFLIRRGGELVQFVACGARAWHAGPSVWRGRSRCNDFSIGIELEGTDERTFTARQYARLATLVRLLRAAYPSLLGIAGHSEIAPGRKTDPGNCFDWRKLANEAGLPDDFRPV